MKEYRLVGNGKTYGELDLIIEALIEANRLDCYIYHLDTLTGEVKSIISKENIKLMLSIALES